MNTFRRYSAAVLTLALSVHLGGCSSDDVAPSVVSTSPANGETQVEAGLVEISVTFNEEMMDGNWSWVYEDRNTFPQMTGQPRYEHDGTRNVLPVRLEPDKEYVIWVNQSGFQNFKDKAGNAAEPYRFTFTTSPG